MPIPEPIIIEHAARIGEAIPYFEETHPFSNPYPCPVFYRGVNYSSAEHAYQAQKFDANIYPNIVAEIVNAPGVDEIKAIVGKNRRFKRADWDQVKFRIMIEINLEKFRQNQELRDLLLSSEGQMLIEHSPDDNCWGMVTAEDGLARGHNFAGRILQIVRKKLSEEA